MTFRSAELAQWRGDSTLVAFLGCSKCCERVECRTAGERALASGIQTQVLRLVVDAYGGSRLVRVHGVVAHLVTVSHSLIAGCSFA